MKLMQRLVVVVSLCSVFYTQSGGYYIIKNDLKTPRLFKPGDERSSFV